jgi:hypothetical protein
MWINLLRRISFIDGVTQQCKGYIQIHLDVLHVAQFRDSLREKYNETLSISWYKEDSLISEFDGLVHITLPIQQKGQKWAVKTEFFSTQIRKKTDLVKSSLDFTLCA